VLSSYLRKRRECKVLHSYYEASDVRSLRVMTSCHVHYLFIFAIPFSELNNTYKSQQWDWSSSIHISLDYRFAWMVAQAFTVGYISIGTLDPISHTCSSKDRDIKIEHANNTLFMKTQGSFFIVYSLALINMQRGAKNVLWSCLRPHKFFGSCSLPDLGEKSFGSSTSAVSFKCVFANSS